LCGQTNYSLNESRSMNE